MRLLVSRGQGNRNLASTKDYLRLYKQSCSVDVISCYFIFLMNYLLWLFRLSLAPFYPFMVCFFFFFFHVCGFEYLCFFSPPVVSISLIFCYNRHSNKINIKVFLNSLHLGYSEDYIRLSLIHLVKFNQISKLARIFY